MKYSKRNLGVKMMRSIVENHVEDFLEMLTYEKSAWYDFWKALPFSPITERYESQFENFKELIKNISRKELTRFSHDFENYKGRVKEETTVSIRAHANDLELDKEDFVIFLIVGPGVKDWVVIDGKVEKIIVFDAFSLWKRGKLQMLPDALYQAAVHYRHGELEGMYYDKNEIFEFLKVEIEKLKNEELLEKIPILLDEYVPYYNWTGFYIMNEEGLLELGPYVGEPTDHVKIAVGRGICGQAAETKMTFIVQDVTQETNYLSCSPHVRSEIVVPILRRDGSVYGEIDIDSHYVAPFDERDNKFLEWIAKQIQVRVVHWCEYQRSINIAYLDSYISYILNEIIKHDIYFKVDLFICSNPELVPENLFKFWKVSKKLSCSKINRVSIVDRVEDQTVVLLSDKGRYVIDYKTLLLSVPEILYKMIRELREEISWVLYIIHHEATRYAQSFINSKLIIEYTLQPDSNINTMIYAFLTGITAGYSGAFNRAMFFYYADGKFFFQKALGPRTLEEAHRVWEAIEDIDLNMKDFLDNVSKDFKSTLELPYEGKFIDAELIKGYVDGMPRVFSKEEMPIIAEQYDITKEFALMVLKSGNDIVGLLLADNNFDLKPITDYQLNVLKDLGQEMILVIENKRFLDSVKQKAETDSLTGLKTRRMLQEFLKDYHFSEFSLAFLDLDKFKMVNDKYGHAKGDEVLAKFGKCINLNIRRDDLAFRYGGDEAVIVIKTADRNKVEKVLTRIYDCFFKSTELTFSSGVAIYPKEGDTQKVLKLADKRCYKSKSTNKIEFD
ncbi:MAG TPA: diguanylate cyclase [Fervidobacterium sp.]|nr:diguanylate cyclase [Fervidobacterium sp.]